jgi:hypothetical protein
MQVHRKVTLQLPDQATRVDRPPPKPPVLRVCHWYHLLVFATSQYQQCADLVGSEMLVDQDAPFVSC